MKQIMLHLSLVLSCCSVMAMSQGDRKSTQKRNYDPSTQIEVKGVIEGFVSRPARHSNATGWHLKLNTGDRSWFVHLGPKWFYDKQKVKLEKGMQVEIEGSLLKRNGEDFIVAKEIDTKKGEIKVRDDNGKPYFSKSR